MTAMPWLGNIARACMIGAMGRWHENGAIHRTSEMGARHVREALLRHVSLLGETR